MIFSLTFIRDFERSIRLCETLIGAGASMLTIHGRFFTGYNIRSLNFSFDVWYKYDNDCDWMMMMMMMMMTTNSGYDDAGDSNINNDITITTSTAIIIMIIIIIMISILFSYPWDQSKIMCNLLCAIELGRRRDVM